MGKTMRRVTEAVLQGLQFLGPATDKNFQPTSNSRNEVMFKEAAAFSLHIRTMEKDLRAMEKQMTGQLANLRDVMITPLPKVYDRLNMEGEVLAREDPSVPPHLSTIGRDINYDKLAEAMTSLSGCLEDEVYRPMHDWLKEFKRVQGEMKILEALRLELDSRKRTVAGLDRKLTLQRDKSIAFQRQESSAHGAPLRLFGSARHGGGPETKLEDVMEKTAQRKAKKEEKTGANQSNFDRQELDTFSRLETLILDASSLREYAATSLYHVRECFSTALSAFEAGQRPGMSPAPLPAAEAPQQPAAAAATHQAKLPGPRSAGGGGGGADSPAYHALHDQSAAYDQSGGFDAVPLSKLAPAAPPADAAPRYIRQLAAAAAPPARFSNSPSARYIH